MTDRTVALCALAAGATWVLIVLVCALIGSPIV